MENKLAPIVLFVYNRPWHTLQTLESLKNNELASESELFIYADGPKENASEDDLIKIKETREIIKQSKWCEKVNIIESSENKGLANSIIDGVTKVVNEYGKVIVLEDDLITSKGFLRYMNDALRFYENEKSVMQVSGYLFPIKLSVNENFFIKGGISTWGWGTWSRAWVIFDRDGEKLYRKIIEDKELVRRFNYDSSYNYLKMLEECVNGKYSSWGIRWYASVFLSNGLGLFPYKSLVNNIGHDGSGVHCGKTSVFSNDFLQEKVIIQPIKIEENIKLRRQFTSFYNEITKNSILNKVKLKIKSLKLYK